MKTLKEIQEQIKENRASIQAMTAEVLRLDYTEERRAAAQNGNGLFNNQTWKEYHEAAKANAEKIAELSNKIYIAEVKARILQANARAALINEATPVILKACEKYNGKPYGEKTRDKIREEVRAAGYSFYFEGYEDYRIVVYELNEEGYKTPATTEATATANDEAGHIDRFITKENKLNIANVIIKPADSYTENPTKEAAKIAKAIKAYSEATKALEKQRGELCAILPDGIKNPDYVKEYYVSF